MNPNSILIHCGLSLHFSFQFIWPTGWLAKSTSLLVAFAILMLWTAYNNALVLSILLVSFGNKIYSLQYLFAANCRVHAQAQAHPLCIAHSFSLPHSVSGTAFWHSMLIDDGGFFPFSSLGFVFLPDAIFFPFAPQTHWIFWLHLFCTNCMMFLKYLFAWLCCLFPSFYYYLLGPFVDLYFHRLRI